MKPKLEEYDDYRQFMLDSFNYSKSQNPYWSFQAWAKKIGLADSSTLLKIVRGEREAGPKIQKLLTEYFSFSINETIYFQDLIKLSKLKNDFHKIQNSLGQKKKHLSMLNDFFEYKDESKEVKNIFQKLVPFSVNDYMSKDNFYFRTLIQFALPGKDELYKEYFQEHVVLRRDFRIFSSTSHFIKKQNGRYKAYCELDNNKQVIVKKFDPLRDDNVEVQYNLYNLPVITTFLHSIDESWKPKLCTLSFFPDKMTVSGEIEKVLVRRNY